MTRRIDLWRLTLLGMLAIASGLVGCSVFQEQISPKLTAEVTPAAAPNAPPEAKYVVEIRPEKDKPQAVERPLVGEMHVQMALEQTGASKRFKRMEIELVRPLPSGGWHKMTLEYDRQERRVPPQFDYSLLPGDRIIVKEDTTSILDDFMARTLVPLGIEPPSKKPRLKDKYEIRG
jgi:hypothetical protein